MKVIKSVMKNDMTISMQSEAKATYEACGDDCPKCRVSDG